MSDSTAYDPFGKTTDTTGTKRPIGYQGDYTDPDTNQVNMTARWYDPNTGAFTSRDDATLPTNPSSDANRYSYGSASPTTHTDPTGHTPCGLPPDVRVLTGGCGSLHHPQNQGCCSNPGPAKGSASGSIQGPGSGPGNRSGGPGAGGGKGGGGGGSGGGTEPPPPDPSQRARELNRDAARNNPMPIPNAMQAPLYGGSVTPPVSSAPDIPSDTTSDFQDPVDDVNEGYQQLQDSLTDDGDPVLGTVKDIDYAPSEVTPANYPIDPGNDQTVDPLQTIIEENSPRTNDPNELISIWGYLSGPGREDFWNMGLGNGENACFGQTACQEAWLYLLDHPDDIAGAKTIAATYCMYHRDECAGDATFDQFIRGAMHDVLMLLGLRLGGAGGGAGVTRPPPGLQDLAARRAALGAPPAGPGVSPTLSRLDVEGMSPLYGTSKHGRDVTLTVNPISRTHAETDVMQQLANVGGAHGAKATLYVDYPAGLCGACGRSGAVRSMARQVGISELTVVWPGGSMVIVP